MRATVIWSKGIGYIHKIGRIRGAKVNTKGEMTMGSSALPGGWSFQGLSGVRTTANEMLGEMYDLLAV